MAQRILNTTGAELDAVTLAAEEIGEALIAAGRAEKPVGVEVAALIVVARMLAQGLEPGERKRVFELGLATASIVSSEVPE